MARIEGAAYTSAGVVKTDKDAHIEYTVGSYSIANNTTAVNVKCYVDNISGVSIPSITGATLKLQYTGGTEVNVAITPNGTSIAVGSSYLLGETDFNIPHSKNGSALTTTLTGYAILFPSSDVFRYISVSGNITLPKISNGHIKISSLWKDAFHWIKVSGAWKRAIIWIKISGVWKKGK